ncbi:fatty-acid amide hydrolase 2-A-like isoform X2 [Neocloeon triangulifer]|uniref:fatty-acid amide hydrolase 2-A-like isoform X2 n=1 Tax=Neocloeon triangulifer TaxID=2078957 RepID=UPI00286EC0D6|nr:fatty-acid amide hydrolase 2-A-like isoform X2 [Neocloeon triangulifer]
MLFYTKRSDSKAKEMLSACAKRLLWLLVWMAAVMASPFIWLKSLRRPKSLPRIRNPLLLQSATTLAQKIRTQQVSSEEVMRAVIARTKEVQPQLNCVVDERYEDALKEAQQVDQMIRSGVKTVEQMEQETPFLGVPFSVKESIAVQGLSNTSGQKLHAPKIASQDAHTVTLVRAAGGIPFVVTNTPELCMCYETDNNNTGRTNNPYDLRRSPGGSSGGEAALLASAGSVVGLASDVGGSARLPAAFTGIFGHKPSPGFVSNEGHCPSSSDPNWDRFFSVALMGRYAEDLAPTLKVMAGGNAPALNLDRKVDLKGMRICYVEDDGGVFTRTLNPEVKSALRKAVNHLEKSCGVKAEKLCIDELKDIFEIASTILLKMNGVECMFQAEPGSKEWKSVTWEWVRYFACMSDYTFPPLLYGMLKRVADRVSEEDFREMVAANQRIKTIFKEKLGEHGVVLFPSFVEPALLHREIYYKFLNVSYLVTFNATEMPVTNCPVAISSQGLPIGIQVAANPLQDRLTIAVAQELERAFGGWTPPPADQKETV